jgi:hypothetical protein
MLLAFSYMMLFEIKSENQPIHWTEIYVIITISAMFIEDIRKVFSFYLEIRNLFFLKHFIEYLTQMLERWHTSDFWIINLYLLPYILFYIGIGLHFGSKERPDLFTSARLTIIKSIKYT